MDNFDDYYYLSYLANLENKKLERISRKEVVCNPKLNKNSRILDIGTYGKSAVLGSGKNTSSIISSHYKDCLIDGINLESECLIDEKTNINVIYGDFFKFKPEYKYDYIINDISFKYNRFILETDYIIKEIPKILNSGGYYLHWVHRNDMSSIDLIQNSIEERRRFITNFWGTRSPELYLSKMREVVQEKFESFYTIEFCYEEYERDYINWFMLRLK